jgi:hypothetical protein
MSYQSQGVTNRFRSFDGEGPNFDAPDQATRFQSLGAVSRALSLVGHTPFMDVLAEARDRRGSTMAADEQVGEGPPMDYIRSIAT